MAFIEEVPYQEAGEQLRSIYDATERSLGYVPNYAKAFSLRPSVYQAWGALLSAIRSGMDARLYELVTVSAAVQQRSSYCTLAHGKVLLDAHMSDDELQHFLEGDTSAGLSDLEAAVVAFAAKVTRDAPSVTQADVDELRGFGLTDEQVLDVVLATAARNFFSRVLDGVGAEPDPVYWALPDGIRAAATLGREIEAA
jgi:uncharacterized peroxidase-related enzyme